MAQAVQRSSRLPSRKSRNTGEWFSRHFLRRPSANALRNSSRVSSTPSQCSWSGAFS